MRRIIPASLFLCSLTLFAHARGTTAPGPATRAPATTRATLPRPTTLPRATTLLRPTTNPIATTRSATARGPSTPPPPPAAAGRSNRPETMIGSRAALSAEQAAFVDSVQDALERYDASAADKAVTQYLAAHPDDEKALLVQALLLRGGSNPKSSLPLFEKLAAAKPDTPEGQAAHYIVQVDKPDNAMQGHKRLLTLAQVNSQHMGLAWLNAIGSHSVGHFSEFTGAFNEFQYGLQFVPEGLMRLPSNIGSPGYYTPDYVESSLRERESFLRKVATAWNCELLARELLALHAFEEADDTLANAVILDPKYLPAWQTWAAVKLRQGRFDDALAKIKTALQLAPDDPRTLSLHALYLQKTGPAAVAYETYKLAAMAGKISNPQGGLMPPDALQKLPADKAAPEIWKYLSDGKNKEAETILQSMLAKNPTDARISFMLAVCVRGHGDLGALKFFQQAASLAPDSPQGQCARLMVGATTSDSLQPVYEVCSFANSHLDDPFILWAAAIAARTHGNNSDALYFFGKLFEKTNVGTSDMHLMIANAYHSLDDPVLELPHRQMAAQLDPTGRTLCELANVYHDLDYLQDADAAYAKSAALAPSDTTTWHMWAQTLNAAGHFEEAIVKCKKAVAADPENARAYNTWGLALQHLGKNDEALQRFDRAAQIDPAWDVPVRNAADLRKALNKKNAPPPPPALPPPSSSPARAPSAALPQPLPKRPNPFPMPPPNTTETPPQ